ncbi:MAG: hypothetical protein HY319_30790 [Armatimonadetes bacterium]|nr:hypothetical protein [Armatimonadota bacterium]
MKSDADRVSERIEAEIERFRVDEAKQAIKSYLVPPRCEKRISDREDVHPCWLIAELPDDFGIVYDEGATDPWGIIRRTDNFIGSDDFWFLTLEDAFYQSGWTGPRPANYEVS